MTCYPPLCLKFSLVGFFLDPDAPISNGRGLCGVSVIPTPPVPREWCVQARVYVEEKKRPRRTEAHFWLSSHERQGNMRARAEPDCRYGFGRYTYGQRLAFLGFLFLIFVHNRLPVLTGRFQPRDYMTSNDGAFSRTRRSSGFSASSLECCWFVGSVVIWTICHIA